MEEKEIYLLEYEKMFNAILNDEPILSKEESRLKMEEFIKQ